ncbi:MULTISPECIES: DUF6916 family protein [Shewanella]|uniref:DUF6916 family protein n=1 Tax=Shewanella TaxID=22 RepID=UPI00048F06EB|nr:MULTISPECIES: hypothetical protein [Shewanella]QLE87648.1 hypothetical protein FLM48_22740 [Shewanella sp. Scap07]
MDNIELFNYGVLSNLIGESIQVSDEHNNQITVKIASIDTAIGHSAEGECFNLRLKDDKANQIPQGTYTFFHPDFGQQQLFCSATSAHDYEIIINRRQL